jgi:hypothetical protein
MDDVLEIALGTKPVIEPPRPRRQNNKEDTQDEE